VPRTSADRSGASSELLLVIAEARKPPIRKGTKGQLTLVETERVSDSEHQPAQRYRHATWSTV
jgi:hypothetical protein